jgi:hypothetical protein
MPRFEQKGSTKKETSKIQSKSGELSSGVEATTERQVTDDELAEYIDSLPQVFEENDCEPLIHELEELFVDFEQSHDIEALHEINELSPHEATLHPIREPARKALEAIVQKLKELDTLTDIDDQRFTTLSDRYQQFSRAVGIINKHNVDHARSVVIRRTLRPKS